MNVMIRLYLIHIRESERERRDYLYSLAQARSEEERRRAQRTLDDHDARIRGVRAALESKDLAEQKNEKESN